MCVGVWMCVLFQPPRRAVRQPAYICYMGSTCESFSKCILLPIFPASSMNFNERFSCAAPKKQRKPRELFEQVESGWSGTHTRLTFVCGECAGKFVLGCGVAAGCGAMLSSMCPFKKWDRQCFPFCLAPVSAAPALAQLVHLAGADAFMGFLNFPFLATDSQRLFFFFGALRNQNTHSTPKNFWTKIVLPCNVFWLFLVHRWSSFWCVFFGGKWFLNLFLYFLSFFCFASNWFVASLV